MEEDGTTTVQQPGTPGSSTVDVDIQSTINPQGGSQNVRKPQTSENQARIERLEEAMTNIMILIRQQTTEEEIEDEMNVTTEQRIRWMEKFFDKLLQRQGETARENKTTNEIMTQTETTEGDENRREKRKPTFSPLPTRALSNKENYYEKYLTLKLKIEEKLRLYPYDIKWDLERKGGLEIEALVSAGVDSYTITTKDHEQSEELKRLKEVCSTECTILGHKNYNSSKVFIYVETFDMFSPDDFK